MCEHTKAAQKKIRNAHEHYGKARKAASASKPNPVKAMTHIRTGHNALTAANSSVKQIPGGGFSGLEKVVTTSSDLYKTANQNNVLSMLTTISSVHTNISRFIPKN